MWVWFMYQKNAPRAPILQVQLMASSYGVTFRKWGLALTSVLHHLVCGPPDFKAVQQAKKSETKNRTDAVRSPEISVNLDYHDGPVGSPSGNKARATIGDAGLPNSTTLRLFSISNARRPSSVWVIAYLTYRSSCIILAQAKFQCVLY